MPVIRKAAPNMPAVAWYFGSTVLFQTKQMSQINSLLKSSSIRYEKVSLRDLDILGLGEPIQEILHYRVERKINAFTFIIQLEFAVIQNRF